MAIGKDKFTINVEIDREVRKQLELLSKELGISLSNLLNNLIVISLHDFDVFKYTGLLMVLKNLKDVLEKIPQFEFKGHPSSYSEDTETVSVTVNRETKELLDKYSDYLDNIPIKKLARNFIYSTLDDYNFLKKTGLIKIAYTFKKLIEIHQEFDEEHID